MAGGETPSLDGADAKHLYDKLDTVETSVTTVQTALGSLQTTLTYMASTSERLEKTISSLDSHLYGKDGASDGGLFTRVMLVETAVRQIDHSRRATAKWLWTAVGALTLETAVVALKFIVFK